MEASKLEGQWRGLAERFRDNANNDSGETDVKATAAVCGPVLPRMRDAGIIPANLILEPSAAELQEHAGQPDVIAHFWSTCWISFVSVISHPRINPGFPTPNPLAITSEHRGGPEQVTVGRTDTKNWQIRARNYAAVCDWLADETANHVGRAKLRAFGIAVQLVGQKMAAIDVESEPIIAEHRAEIDRLYADYRDVVQRIESEWEADFGAPYPRDIEDWQRWAARVGWSGERIADGNWKPRDLFPIIEGYLQRLRDQSGSTKGQGDETADDPQGTGGMSWQEAAERLERLRQQGEPYTSQQKFAKQFGCAPATINKAIRNTPSLKVWAKVDPTPKAQSINEVVTDSTAQNRELGPEDEAAIREYLERDDITPEERAFFNGLSPADQLIFLDDPDADNGILHMRILNRTP